MDRQWKRVLSFVMHSRIYDLASWIFLLVIELDGWAVANGIALVCLLLVREQTNVKKERKKERKKTNLCSFLLLFSTATLWTNKNEEHWPPVIWQDCWWVFVCNREKRKRRWRRRWRRKTSFFDIVVFSSSSSTSSASSSPLLHIYALVACIVARCWLPLQKSTLVCMSLRWLVTFDWLDVFSQLVR
jgi:hypothetical protein